MPTEVLDAIRDEDAWRHRLEECPSEQRDVYFTPEYVALHRFHPHTRALLFTYAHARYRWMQPFLLTAIDRIGHAQLDPAWNDIESAYGYGGPLTTSQDADFLAEAHGAFHEWCISMRVIAEFTRLHPLIGNVKWVDPRTKTELNRQTVSLDLQRYRQDPWLFDGGTRNMLRRAGRAGVTVGTMPAATAMDEFVKNYRATMDRVGADKYYSFNDVYFEGLRKLVVDRGWLVAGKANGLTVGGALFLRGQDTLHYHLATAAAGPRVQGVSNLIIGEGARLGAEAGLRRLHLGGGLTRESSDSLFAFKRTMGTDLHDYHVARRVHVEDGYQRVRSLWADCFPNLVARCGGRILCYRSAE